MGFRLNVDIFVFAYYVKPPLTPQVIHVWNIWFTICLIVHHLRGRITTRRFLSHAMIDTHWSYFPSAMTHFTYESLVHHYCDVIMGRDGVSNHQLHDCLFNRLFRHISKKKSKLLVTGLRAGNSAVTGEFSAQMGSNAENVSIWRHQHDTAIN